MPPFALNHMSVARASFARLLDIAADLGCVGVEARNDLPGPLFDGMRPEAAREMLAGRNLRLLALAEVKRFDDWSPAKMEEARALAGIARAAGAEAVSLIPRNDNPGMGRGERQAMLRRALGELRSMLEDHEITGLVEPLGFATCALRHKAEAVEAIDALGAAGTFRIVHDTFHHHLAGGGPLFSAHTGIVHISGVTDPDLGTPEMGDRHRMLVDERDRLGNLDQIAGLVAQGYAGPISFEAFAPAVHDSEDPRGDLRRSMEFIRARLAAEAA